MPFHHRSLWPRLNVTMSYGPPKVTPWELQLQHMDVINTKFISWQVGVIVALPQMFLRVRAEAEAELAIPKDRLHAGLRSWSEALVEAKGRERYDAQNPDICWDKQTFPFFFFKSRYICGVCLNSESFNIQRSEKHLENTRKVIGSDVTIIITKRITYGNRILS